MLDLMHGKANKDSQALGLTFCVSFLTYWSCLTYFFFSTKQFVCFAFYSHFISFSFFLSYVSFSLLFDCIFLKKRRTRTFDCINNMPFSFLSYEWTYTTIISHIASYSFSLHRGCCLEKTVNLV